jgi:23S rRNA maturation mini-RNase III
MLPQEFLDGYQGKFINKLSLETLIGYLYLHNPERLQQLLEKLSVDFT